MAAWEVEIRIMVQGQPSQKVLEIPFQSTVHGGACLSSQLGWEAQIGRWRSRLAWVYSETLSQKKLKQKGLLE
jgi:hypothetical protein